MHRHAHERAALPRRLLALRRTDTAPLAFVALLTRSSPEERLALTVGTSHSRYIYITLYSYSYKGSLSIVI